jgi:chorismate dehydratase
MRPAAYRLGVVSFLNARPLIEGLAHEDVSVDMRFDVPARLPELLDNDEVDAALVPVIDLAEPRRRWHIVSDACVGCDGPTLTVRVFSQVPAERMRVLLVDGDSHTSVALASVIWREMFGVTLKTRPLAGRASGNECDAVLLIGDKVIGHGLDGFDIEIDLGEAWKSLTGLPFVFAVWAARRRRGLGDLANLLTRARDRGLGRLDMLAEDVAPRMGWPVELAREYLTRRLVFTLDAPLRRGLERFLDLAGEHGVVPERPELLYA